MSNIFEKEYIIKYSDVDRKNYATIVALAEYMQEVASMNSEICGVGREFLTKNNMGWILLENRVKIFNLPLLNEKIKVRTWPNCLKGICVYRQYEILDSKDNIICVGTSKWIMYSLENKMPVRIKGEIADKYEYNEKTVIENEFINIKDEEKYDEINISEVFYRDVDTNWHMNNIKYLRCLIDSIDVNFLDKYTIEEYSIKYIHQLLYIQKFEICTNKISENEYMYYIKQTDNRLKDNNCEVYIKWKER